MLSMVQFIVELDAMPSALQRNRLFRIRMSFFTGYFIWSIAGFVIAYLHQTRVCAGDFALEQEVDAKNPLYYWKSDTLLQFMTVMNMLMVVAITCGSIIVIWSMAK